ncbi:hypothetical protein [Aeromonas enteropelogenes]|uniref:hypothetical protein n=1 Tax=Aeromonas enteropelogenes TaxID=29489 RepID=UPI003BA20FFB
MTWQTGALTLPSSFSAIPAAAETVLARVPAEQTQKVARLAALNERAHYRPSPLAAEAAALSALRSKLDALLATGQALTVTPFTYQVAQQQGQQWALSADNATKALARKLRDSADPLRPRGALHAVGWLVCANSQAELASALATVCAVLPLPDWVAALRRMNTSNEVMAKPAAPAAPLWRPAEPLTWAPLRNGQRLAGAELAQLESLASGLTTPLSRLEALADKRVARLHALAQAIEALSAINGQLWHWSSTGSPDSLAAQLDDSHPPEAMSMSAGALLLSPEPLTFWLELTP